jgi:hypothetical protein
MKNPDGDKSRKYKYNKNLLLPKNILQVILMKNWPPPP